jgi:poly(A) polymerase
MSSNYAEKLKHPVFKVVSQCATEHGLDAYVIGGFVRDLVMERPSKDIDILVLGDGPEFAEAVAKILRVKKVSVFKNFGTAHFRYKDLDVEFVGARKESYSRDSRKPITEKGTLQDDQNRRDFTINTLALKLNTESFGELVDPFGGVLDIEKGIIRTPLEPEITFSDDPLRMLRAIRFATQLDFKIAGPSLEAIQKQPERIAIVSMERISTELNKIMSSEKPSRGFYLLKASGLLPHIFP